MLEMSGRIHYELDTVKNMLIVKDSESEEYCDIALNLSSAALTRKAVEVGVEIAHAYDQCAFHAHTSL